MLLDDSLGLLSLATTSLIIFLSPQLGELVLLPMERHQMTRSEVQVCTEARYEHAHCVLGETNPKEHKCHQLFLWVPWRPIGQCIEITLC